MVNAKIFCERVRRARREAVIQLAAIAACLLWSRCQASLSPKVVYAVTGLRLGAWTEEQGLDLRLHGERGYNMGSRTSDMKYIIAVIQPHRLEAVREALADYWRARADGQRGARVRAAEGPDRGLSRRRIHHEYVPKVKLEIAVSAALADSVVEASATPRAPGISATAKCSCFALEGAMRVRTGEMGADAL